MVNLESKDRCSYGEEQSSVRSMELLEGDISYLRRLRVPVTRFRTQKKRTCMTKYQGGRDAKGIKRMSRGADLLISTYSISPEKEKNSFMFSAVAESGMLVTLIVLT